MKYTEYGLKITLEELRQLLERAENEAQFHNMENCLYIKGGDRPEIKQYCCYAKCKVLFETVLNFKKGEYKMELRIDQNVLDRFPNLNVTKENDVVTVKFNEGNGNSDFLFPLNFPLTNLDNISWSRIDEIGRAGKARTFFALGATKKDYMKNGFVAEYQIMDFDHDDLADGSGKAPISWDMIALYKDEIYMKRNSESSCWDECDGRTFLNGEFYDNMSDELRAIVKPVWKLTANKNGEIVKSKDYVWLKSEKELYGRTFYSNDGEGYWYALFMQEDFPWFKLNGDNEKDWQWLRSVRAGGTYLFCFVNTDGSPGNSNSGYSRGVAPGFCS